MGPLGPPELIMILIVILLLFGAKKIPQLARGLGKSLGEFKSAKEDFERELTLDRSEGKAGAKPETASRPNHGEGV